MTRTVRENEPTNVPTEKSEPSLVNLVVRFKERNFVRRAMLALPSWITPNGVTIFRGALMMPVMMLVLMQSYWWAGGLFVFSILLDFVDGALAEARDEKSELGAFLDPLVDKATIWMLLGALAGSMPLGWWLFWVVFIFGGLLTAVRVKKILDEPLDENGQHDIKARPAGKMKLIAEVTALLLVLLGLATEVVVLVWLGSALMLVAAILGGLSLHSHLFRRGANKAK